MYPFCLIVRSFASNYQDGLLARRIGKEKQRKRCGHLSFRVHGKPENENPTFT